MNCIDGNGANNNLPGTAGADCLRGLAGNDNLRGLAGNDTLTGGSGADRFTFHNITEVNYLGGTRYLVKSDHGNDIISDFNHAAGDRIFDSVNGFYELGNVGGTPEGGTPPGGNGNRLGLLNFTAFWQISGGSLFPGFQTDIAPASIELTQVDNPGIPFNLFDPDSLRGLENVGNSAATFSVTPTSQYSFEQEVLIAENMVEDQFINISKTNAAGYKQVVIVAIDPRASKETQIFGTEFSDSLLGDQLAEGNRDDVLFGFAGNDTLRGQSGKDIVLGGLGNDVIDGGSEEDTQYGNSGKDTINGGSENDILNGGAGNDNLNGNSDNDSLLGWIGNDILRGGTGDDLLDGQFGKDTLQGGAGNDTLVGGSENDVINGGSGQDLLLERGTSFQLTDSNLLSFDSDSLTPFENDQLFSIEMAGLYGIETDDDINASQFTRGNVTLDGGAGDDTLIGGAGDDRLVGQVGNDRLYGGRGNDNLSGDSGQDVLVGVATSLVMPGLGEIDILSGGGNADKFLLGQIGKNYYDDGVISATNSGEGDYALILDFQDGIDTIQVKGNQGYFIDDISLNGASGAGIYENKGLFIRPDGTSFQGRELIGLVAGVSAASLSVNNGGPLTLIT